MAGGWRISNEDELVALRRARFDARTLRTEEAWNRFAAQVARCEELGLLDDAANHHLDAEDAHDAARPSERAVAPRYAAGD
jgi:hypothetical protein